MPRGVVDLEGLKGPEAEALRRMAPPAGLPFKVLKLGHVVLRVKDLQRSVAFYTGVLGFRVSDVYPQTMMKGGMVFLRCNTDHHCLALVGGMKEDASAREMHHLAFELATLEELLRSRDHLRKHGVKIDYEGRRRAGCQMAVEFRDPDNHFLELYWGLDQVGSDGRIRPPGEWCEEATLEDAIANPPPGQDTTLHSK
ncbi:MAG: VOC family protein [Betaproteobacteria bacterium]|nr:VOC family protein [Betaproteobacteria bacterium]MDH5349875.1 VOC family protein [Betaproteobacteria bacterium]